MPCSVLPVLRTRKTTSGYASMKTRRPFYKVISRIDRSAGVEKALRPKSVPNPGLQVVTPEKFVVYEGVSNGGITPGNRRAASTPHLTDGGGLNG